MKTIPSWAPLLALFSSLALLIHAEEMAVVNADNVNVRGRPTISSEVVTQLNRGDQVTLLERVTLEKPAEGEPAQWARIRMPEETGVWVFAPFIDPAASVVTASRLNMRSGPGQNFSVVGRIEKGTKVEELRTTNNWVQIKPPASAYAFVAAELLDAGTQADAPAVASVPEPSASAEPATAGVTSPETSGAGPETDAATALAVSPAVQEPEPTSTIEPEPSANSESVLAQEDAGPLNESLPSATAPSEPESASLAAIPPVGLDEADVEEQPQAGLESEAVLVSEPEPEPAPVPPRRIVRREGIVRSTFSIQAPTYFELISPETRKTINYLHDPSQMFSLKDYKGRRIVVTGEEGIDKRWPNTPVIEVETLELAR